MLSLKQAFRSVPVGFQTKKETKGSKILSGFFFASLITGANWYVQQQWAERDIERQDEIIKRVNHEEALQRVDDLKSAISNDEIEGKKVKVQGELQPGRFIIKRNRGEQEGYLVLAPFIVKKVKGGRSAYDKNDFNKYMLNLGWVPKESKNKIRQAAAIDVLEFDELPDQLADYEVPPITSTVTAYVRRGEERDILRGYNNWVDQRLYKYIDLNLLAAIFGGTNPCFRQVYLDRTIQEEGEQSFPFPNTKDNYIQELNNNKAEINKRASNATYGVGLASYAAAVLLAAL